MVQYFLDWADLSTEDRLDRVDSTIEQTRVE